MRFFSGLRSLHIHDATIEYSNQPVPIVASQTCSTVRLSKIRFVVSSSVEKHLCSPGQTKDRHHLFVALGHKSSLSIEDCVLETTFDCPSLVTLVVCTAAQGGQVREILVPAYCYQLCMPNALQLRSCTCHLNNHALQSN
jgi:hypothetical protein